MTAMGNDEGRRQELMESLAKIRHHTNSKLENQRAPAQLLVAIESSLQESVESGQNDISQSTSPTAYLLALTSTLKKLSFDDIAVSFSLYFNVLLCSLMAFADALIQ